jgi:hypothetical protein
MSVSPDGGSATPASPAYDHGCQNGCGRPADTIVVNLTSSDCDILCRTCAMLMFVAVFRQLAETGRLDGAGEVAPTPA